MNRVKKSIIVGFLILIGFILAPAFSEAGENGGEAENKGEIEFYEEKTSSSSSSVEPPASEPKQDQKNDQKPSLLSFLPKTGEELTLSLVMLGSILVILLVGILLYKHKRKTADH